MVQTTTPKPFESEPGDEMSYEANRRAILALQRAREYTIEGDNNDNDILNKLVVEEPPQFRNHTFMEILHNLPYNETIFTSKVEEYFYKGLHLTFCRVQNVSVVIVSKLCFYTTNISSSSSLAAHSWTTSSYVCFYFAS